MRVKKKSTFWIFRFFSGRGTDQRICAEMPAGTTMKDALESAKEWASKETFNTACREYTVHVKKTSKPPAKKVWRRKWEKLYNAYQKAKDRRDEWAAINNPRRFE